MANPEQPAPSEQKSKVRHFLNKIDGWDLLIDYAIPSAMLGAMHFSFFSQSHTPEQYQRFLLADAVAVWPLAYGIGLKISQKLPRRMVH